MTEKTRVVTGVVRGSYVHVVEPKEDMNGNLKYSIQLLIPKTDKATLTAINGAMKEAVTEMWGANPPKRLRSCLRDGDLAGDAGIRDMNVEPGDAPYGGHFFINASNLKRVTVKDNSTRQDIIIPSDVKSGDYFHASLEFYGYDKKSNGIGCSLRGVLWVKEGEALGSDFDASDDFDSIPVSEASAEDLDFIG